MMILVGIAALVAVCLAGKSGARSATRLDKADLHGYEHRSRCDEILPLDYLSH